jgi:soluble lytic murein transglycosylase-like protein
MPGMGKRLQLALMASTVIATFLSLTTPYLQAETGASGTNSPIATTDDNGRKIYVNETAPAAPARAQAPAARSSSLAYWSATEHRWKPVPSVNRATMKAARSAAAEVNQYLDFGGQSHASSFVRGRPFTQEQIDSAIDQAASRHNVDPNLVRAVVKVESNFNPNAVSRKGAMGLMQLMPQTARQLNVTNPFDPEQNIDAGVRHLKRLMENYGGDIKLSLAAYNAGAGAVARSAGVPRFAETQQYVRRITNLYFGGEDGTHILGNPVHDPVRVQRDARGVLYISNTD